MKSLRQGPAQREVGRHREEAWNGEADGEVKVCVCVARDFEVSKETDRKSLQCHTADRGDEIQIVRPGEDQVGRGEAEDDVLAYREVPPWSGLCSADVYVELPVEAEVQDDECGKLIHRLYRCRPAGQAWKEHYSMFLQKGGFKRLQTVPVAFAHPESGMSGVVQGDDFVWEGYGKDLDWVLAVLEKEYELKIRAQGRSQD
jgi:hypothetical protein